MLTSLTFRLSSRIFGPRSMENLWSEPDGGPYVVPEQRQNSGMSVIRRRFVPALIGKLTEIDLEGPPDGSWDLIKDNINSILTTSNRRRTTSLSQRLTPARLVAASHARTIHDLVPQSTGAGRYSREQSLNQIESAIRRRFVPRLFRLLIECWIFIGRRPISRLYRARKEPLKRSHEAHGPRPGAPGIAEFRSID